MKLCMLSGFRVGWMSSATCSVVLLATIQIAGCDSTDVPGPPPDAQNAQLDDAPSSDIASDHLGESSKQPEAVLASLSIGDPAPDLQVDKWITGDPVDQTLSNGVYVVEFWATWCGPCLAGMPHISELQEHHGDDATFIGVTREDAATVETFLEKKSKDDVPWRDVVKYRLVTDLDDATNTAYMKAANQNGIPTAFIVGHDGIVEWIGHPMSIDGPLQQVVDRLWDRDAAVAEFRQRQRMSQFSAQIRGFIQNQQWDQALNAVDSLENEIGKNAGLLRYRMMLLQQSGNNAEAARIRAELVDLVWEEPAALNAIAWEIASSGRSAELELAKRAAEQASNLRADKDAAILDTLARVHYELGDIDQAIHWQRMAVENNSGTAEIDETLEKYIAERKPSDESNSDESDADANDDIVPESKDVEPDDAEANEPAAKDPEQT
jgi:thiol-disulfide isomerase/thioredoxin